MKRLLVLPAALAGCLIVGIWTGYAWPVLTTAYSILGKRERLEEPYCEADPY